MADRTRIPFAWWFDRARTIFRESREYRRARRATARQHRAGARPLMLPSLVCAAVGHSWPAPNGAITFAPWQLSFCSRCNEELCGRASLEDLECAPADIDDAWGYARAGDEP